MYFIFLCSLKSRNVAVVESAWRRSFPFSKRSGQETLSRCRSTGDLVKRCSGWRPLHLVRRPHLTSDEPHRVKHNPGPSLHQYSSIHLCARLNSWTYKLARGGETGHANTSRLPDKAATSQRPRYASAGCQLT